MKKLLAIITIALLLSGITCLTGCKISLPFDKTTEKNENKTTTTDNNTTNKKNLDGVNYKEVDMNTLSINEDLQVNFISTYKYSGDCILVQADGKNILIDAGAKSEQKKYIENEIDRLIGVVEEDEYEFCKEGKHPSKRNLDYIFVSHAHEDHYSNLISGILEDYNITNLYDFNKTNQTYENSNGKKTMYGYYLDLVDKDSPTRSTKIQNKNFFYTEFNTLTKDGKLNEYQLTDNLYITPLYNYYALTGATTTDENDYSICFILTYKTTAKNYTMYFTGDAGKSVESKMLQYYKDLNITLPKADLYKASHHGSDTANSEAFLNAVVDANTSVVFTCYINNKYTNNYGNSFPKQVVLNRIAPLTKKVYALAIDIDRIYTSEDILLGTINYGSIPTLDDTFIYNNLFTHTGRQTRLSFVIENNTNTLIAKPYIEPEDYFNYTGKVYYLPLTIWEKNLQFVDEPETYKTIFEKEIVVLCFGNKKLEFLTEQKALEYVNEKVITEYTIEHLPIKVLPDAWKE